MSASIIVVLLSVLWLLHRTTRLLKVPAPALIHVLGIDVPDIPQVSVDNVTSTTVNLHWAPADKNSNVVKFLVEVDAIRVGELDRSDNNVVLKDLKPNQSYTIRVVAVNVSNYRSHASTVWIHTKKSSEESLPSSVSLRGIRGGEDNNSTSLALHPKLASSGSKANLRNRASSRAASKRDSHPDKQDKVYTVESLTQEVESVQIEINDLLKQAAFAEDEFADAENVLLNELEQLKDRKKQEDAQRSAVRSESKALEDSRRGLETQKLKAERYLEKCQEELDRKQAAIRQWEQDIERCSARVDELEHSRMSLIDQCNTSLEAVRSDIETGQVEIAKLEEEVKKLVSDSKRAEAKQQSIRDCITSIKDSTDSITGLIKPDCIETIKNNPEIASLWSTLEHDIEIETELEAEWQRTQKDLEIRYLRVSKQYQEAGDAYKAAVASVHGGSINTVLDTITAATNAVLPKSKKKARSRKDTGRSINIVQPQISPPQIFDSVDSSLPLKPAIDTSGFNFGNSEKDDDILMSPSVDMLLPSNLLGADDLNESFTQLLNDLPRRGTAHPPHDASERFKRPSASFLAGVLSSKRSSSNGSGISPRPSTVSLRDETHSLGSHSPAMPSSPQSGFATFATGVPQARNTAVSTLGGGPFGNSVSSLVETSNIGEFEEAFSGKSPSASKKFSNMFFFGKPRSNTGGGTSLLFKRTPRDELPIRPMDESVIAFPGSERPSLDIGPIGSRPRAGSYGSMGSGMSNNFFNPWIDSGLETKPSGLLRPSQSNNGSLRSVDLKSSSILNSNWSVFDRRPSETGSGQIRADSGYDSMEANWKGMPMLLVNDGETQPLKHENSNNSIDSRASSGAGSKFTKGWAGFFSSDKSSSDKFKGDQKSIASLFGKSDDDHDVLSASLDSAESTTKESILQKSMRTFTGGGRKSSSSAGSSKFVRKLGLFGKKTDLSVRDSEDEQVLGVDGAILEESSSNEPVDYQTFLSSVSRENSN